MMRYMKKILSAVLLSAMLLAVCCASAAAYTEMTNLEHPDNVRIHLFDYQVKGNTDDNTTTKTQDGKSVTIPTSDIMDKGINAGHALLFTHNHDRNYGWWNGITTGQLVKPYLKAGTGGKYYPVLDLDADNSVHRTGLDTNGSTTSATDNYNTLSSLGTGYKNASASATESLEYLFKQEDGSNRNYYPAKKLLLRDLATNQYYFNSSEYFAQYNENGEFSVYREETGDTSEFFPFDSVSSFVNASANHYFGMLMEVDFYLTDDGKIKYGNKEEDIVFSFSGDDDVFVFVDNLLVGSVGGIHGPRTIDINFRTGEVTEGRDANGENTQSTTYVTSIGQYYDDAKTELQKTTANGGLGMTADQATAHLPTLRTLDGNRTFKANEKHTLRMYYLERGHHSSNMSVYFNLLNPYMPEQDYTLSNAVTGGNDALLALPFAYALTFDMSDVIKDVGTANYVVKNAGGTVLESGKVTFTGSAGSKTISAATKTGGGASSYISQGKAELKNGESITFTLPDQTKVTSVQSLPAKPDALSVNPFELDSLEVVPSSGTTNKDAAKIVANVVNIAGAASATYNNKILTSNVTIAKTVTHADGVEPTTGSFAFSVTGLDDIEKVKDQNYSSFTLGNTGSKTFTVIRGAQFSVGETDDLNDEFIYVSGNAENMTAYEETESVTVTNFYPTPVTASLAAKKSITGRAFKDRDKFEFKATSQSFAPGDIRADLGAVIMPKSGDEKDAAFTEIKFDLSDLGGANSREFTYTISETQNDGNGLTSDRNTYTAKITLTKSGSGDRTTLAASVAYYKGTTLLETGTVPTFVNVYKSTGTLTIPATKTITGREFKSGDSFTFKVEPQTAGAPMFSGVNENGEVTIEPTSDQSHTISFGSLTFDQTHVGNTYMYTFEEVIPETKNPGVSYSTEKYTVTVTLTDDGKGNITAKAVPANISWKNTYTASGSLAVSGVKKITGRKFNGSESFTFGYTASEGAPVIDETDETNDTTVTLKPEAGEAEKNISFGTLTFDQTHVDNTYTYTFTETAGNAGGMTYDTAPKTLSIKVVDNGDGTLKLVDPDTEAEITATDSVLAWTNVYTAKGEAEVKATKAITGRKFIEGDSFTFKIAAVTENAPMPTTTEVTPTLTAGGQSVEIDFGKITFTEAHVGNTYTYTLTEDVKNVPEVGGKYVKENLTYDTEGKTLTIHVTDNGDGTVATAITSEAITFTNSYASSATLDLTDLAKKIMDGRAFREGDSFIFTVTPGEGAPAMVETDGVNDGKVTISPVSGTEAVINFGMITFDQSHAGKTYTYTFEEVEPETGALPSVAYSTAKHTVTVAVSDDGKGNMTLTPTYPQDGIVFTNVYTTNTESGIKGIKKITGREFKAGDSFTFNVTYGSEDTPKLMKGGSAVESVAITPTSGTQAEIDFGTVAFNQDHADKTFTYTFTEADGTRPGLAYDGTSYTVTIEISDDGEGHLTADVTGGDALVWTNSFAQQSGEYRFDVSKSLNGRDIVDGEFSFTMTALGSADYTPGVTEYAYTADEKQPKPDTLKVEAGADGDVPFGPAVFAPELFDREVTGKDGGKVYVYQIEEDIPQDAVPNGENIPVLRGVAYDTTKYKLVVHAYTVEEVIDGVKTVSVKTELAGSDPAIGDGKVTFNNAYQAAQTTAEISMTKHVNGAEPAAAYDGAFTFTLTAQNGAPMPVSGEAGSASMTVSNAGSRIDFGQIVYTAAGEYLYTVKENPLAGHISGMRIDPTAYTMKVTVSDPGDGQLIHQIQFSADPAAENPAWTDALTFDNDYAQPKPEDLAGVKRIMDDDVDRGDDLVYQITITNHTRDTLCDLVVMDEIPEHTAFVSCDAGGVYDAESNRVTFRRERLGAGESATFEMTVRAVEGSVHVTNVAVFGTPDIPETMRGDIPARLTNEVTVYINVKLGDLGKLPNTGDRTHMGWWLMALSASLLGLRAMKKRREA